MRSNRKKKNVAKLRRAKKAGKERGKELQKEIAEGTKELKSTAAAQMLGV